MIIRAKTNFDLVEEFTKLNDPADPLSPAEFDLYALISGVDTATILDETVRHLVQAVRPLLHELTNRLEMASAGYMNPAEPGTYGSIERRDDPEYRLEEHIAERPFDERHPPVYRSDHDLCSRCSLSILHPIHI